MTEARKLRLELQAAQTRIGVLCAERDAYLRQRDEAIGERNELLRQRDEAIGLKNLHAERLARLAHRADLKLSRKPRVGTRDRILLFPHVSKSAGKTLADILLRNFSPGELLTLDASEMDDSAVETGSHQAVETALGRMRQSELDELRVVWGGRCHAIQAHLPKPCDCVTILRDPSARATSNLCHDNHMTRMLSGVVAGDSGPDEAAENIPAVTNAVFEVAAKNLDGFLVIGLEDEFDQTLLVLGAELGWSLTDLVYCPPHAPRPAARQPPHHARSGERDWNRYDAALVERGRRHLAGRIAKYPGDFKNNLALLRWINMLFRKGVSMEELRRMEFHALRP